MKNTIGKIKRVSASEPRLDDFTRADNIKVSRAGKICLENFKKTIATDGTMTIITKRVYKRPTKTNVRLVREAGYFVDIKEKSKNESNNKKNR